MKMISKLSDNFRWIVEITVKLIDCKEKKTSLWIAYDLNVSVALTFFKQFSSFYAKLFN